MRHPRTAARELARCELNAELVDTTGHDTDRTGRRGSNMLDNCETQTRPEGRFRIGTGGSGDRKAPTRGLYALHGRNTAHTLDGATREKVQLFPRRGTTGGQSRNLIDVSVCQSEPAASRNGIHFGRMFRLDTV